MKARIYSWLLAGAYLAWGICLLLYLVPRLQELFSGFEFSVPFLLKVMFIAGPFGCLLITAMIAAFVMLNTQKLHLRFVSLISTIALLAWVAYMANVVFGILNREMVVG